MKYYFVLLLFICLYYISCNNNSTYKEPDYNILLGKKVCIDPEHQQYPNRDLEPIAPDNSIMKEKCSAGTEGIKTGIPEYMVNLEIALKLKQCLDSYGVIVSMTRETNEVDINISNIERAEIGNKSDIMIRLHADGSTDTKASGISILIPSPRFIKDKFIINESKKIASIILNRILNLTKSKNNGITERGDLTGFNWSTTHVILIEMGFLTNEQEDILLNTSNYQDKIINGIC